MKIETDSSVIYNFIQAELDSRWQSITDNSEKLPFSDTNVIQTRDIPRLLFRDFAHNIVNKIKEFEEKNS